MVYGQGKQPMLYGPRGEPLYADEINQEEEESRQDYLEEEWRKRAGAQAEEEWRKDMPTEEEVRAARLARERELEEEEKARKASKREEEGKREELEAKERGRTLSKGSYELARLKQRQELRKTGETAWGRVERGARGTGKVAGAAYKLATFGGPLQRPSRDYYIPKAKAETYVPTGMRALTSLEGEGRTQGAGFLLRQASTPKLGRLREASMLGGGDAGVGSTLIAQISKGGGVPGLGFNLKGALGDTSALTRLRDISVPKGLSKPEEEAYLEIRRNGDVDIPSNIIEDLSKLGIPRQNAVEAIKGLLKKGLIRESGKFGGEAVLEVAR